MTFLWCVCVSLIRQMFYSSSVLLFDKYKFFYTNVYSWFWSPYLTNICSNEAKCSLLSIISSFLTWVICIYAVHILVKLTASFNVCYDLAYQYVNSYVYYLIHCVAPEPMLFVSVCFVWLYIMYLGSQVALSVFSMSHIFIICIHK